ncbi:DNA-(apurinic or apyrimidinic site) endonuclease, chloroplastic-like isoform X2 [Tripterygium wilfordii]|uniref:DNA-(apurinic or apyrimidinic site) endonuclease, chloroplastic-like isoform X2 n=1 Tax=Tripterygium wilfordii TaxID=458696 RepID=UPI0018F80328|nr:DNA-(apurinic or apyrimidinic site) endonuclease, chloroplastic-like isoform X2 [Tripterygium wilfordii]
MNRVLQLGLKNFIPVSSSFAAIPGSFRRATLVSLRVSGMGSKRLLSDSTAPQSASMEDKKEKRLKGLMGTGDNIRIREDPARIEAMTVQELRSTLRSIGVPAKGCKRDLVSALKCFLDKEMDGEGSPVAEVQASSICVEKTTLKEQAKNLANDHVQEIDIISDVSLFQQSKRSVKRSPSGHKTAQVDGNVVKKKQKLTINKDEASGRKASPESKKVSSDIFVENGEDDCEVLPIDRVEPWTILAHKKPQKGWIAYNPGSMRPPPLSGDAKFVKLMSWNVNGIRALLKLEGFSALQLAQRENFDILCLQETKLQEKDVESIKHCLIDGYDNSYWTCSISKLGYSGTAIISRVKPLSVTYGLGMPDHDSEGRLVTAEFDSFFLLCAYVPNSGDGLRRLSYRTTQWDLSLSEYMKELEKSKPVILTGDLNCAHEEIDIYNPAGNRRSAGFTDEERRSFATNFLSRGFADTFRRQHPDVVGYTYWGFRHGGRKTNKGWRLDYFLVSESIADNVHDSYILPDVAGSDHCPIGLILKL